MLPFKLIYHPGYDLNLGEHVFPSQKYRLIRDQLLAEGFAEPGDFVEPEPASDEDILLVHEAGVGDQRLHRHAEPPGDSCSSRFPIRARWWRPSGWRRAARILAAREARRRAWASIWAADSTTPFPGTAKAFAPSTTSPWRCGGLQRDGAIQRAMVVDCDVHHGNGTAAIFRRRPSASSRSPSTSTTIIQAKSRHRQ